MNDSELKAMRERAEKATPGPWDYNQLWETVLAGKKPIADVDGVEMTDDDGFFIAHARTDIPALLDTVDALRALVAGFVQPGQTLPGWARLGDTTVYCNYCGAEVVRGEGDLDGHRIPHVAGCVVGEARRVMGTGEGGHEA